MSIPIESLAADIHAWANEVFPDRTDASMFLKLYGEINELIEAGDNIDEVADEIADLFILLLDYAYRKGMTWVTQAILKKMRENRKRTWLITTTGVMQHAKK